MANIFRRIGFVLAPRLDVTWATPPALEPGWEGHVHKAAHQFQFEPLEVKERDGRPACQLRSIGPTHSMGTRVRDFTLFVSNSLKIPKAHRRQNSLEIRSPRSILTGLVTVLIVLGVLFVVAFGVWKIFLWWSASRTFERSLVVFGPVVFVILFFLAAYLSDADGDVRKPFDKTFHPLSEKEQEHFRRIEERDLLLSAARVRRLPASGDSSIEAEAEAEAEARLVAREGLDYRVRTIRDDRDQLWIRGKHAFLIACVFLVASLVGPATAVWLLIHSHDWHYLLASVSLAAVPLAIGLALLRHDNKIRDQHRDAETELAVLDRLQLALDYAAADSTERQAETRRQVIQQLVQPPKPEAKTVRRRKSQKVDKKTSVDVGAVVEKATDAIRAALKTSE